MNHPRFVGPGVVSAALCLGASVAPAQPFSATLVASGLARPVGVVPVPDGSGRSFIIEQRQGAGGSAVGRVRVMLADGTVLGTPFYSIDVQGASEQGLLGLAFHPGFASNRLLYINYTRRGDGDTIVRELRADAGDPNIAEAGHERSIMRLDQPAANHNGGWMVFGPDGYLYIATGDGGSGDDPWGALGNGQNKASPLGKLLRVDPLGDDFPADAELNYAAPAGNPFEGDAGVNEAIWAWGLRNPWRNDFDPATGDLYIADVGQNAVEEVNFQPASSAGGENYGWRKWEGSLLNFATDPAPDAGDAVFPVTEYSHGSPDFGCSITGGVVVRTCTLADLWGEFLFADFCSDRVYALRQTAGGWVREEITNDITPDVGSLAGITSFGRDAQGRVYICTLGGSVYRLGSDRAGLGDVNADGVLNLDDVEAFAQDFAAMAPGADLDQDGVWNLDDVELFSGGFTAPCP